MSGAVEIDTYPDGRVVKHFWSDEVPNKNGFLYAIECLDPFAIVDSFPGLSQAFDCRYGPVLLEDISGMLGPKESAECIAECLAAEATLDGAFREAAKLEPGQRQLLLVCADELERALEEDGYDFNGEALLAEWRKRAR